MLYAIIALLILILAWGTYRYFQMKEQVKDAAAREQGLDEVEEGYQAEIMDLEDRLEQLLTSFHNLNNTALQERTNLREQHSETVTQYKAMITDLEKEIEDLRQTAFEMQKIIEGEGAKLPDLAGMYMQIDLTAPEAKTAEQIYQETHGALRFEDSNPEREADWEKELHNAKPQSDDS